MKNMFHKLRLNYVLCVLLIAIILFTFLFVFFIPKAQATLPNELIVEDLSTDEAISLRYSNIQRFLNSIQPKRRNVVAKSKIDILYENLNISKNDLSGIEETSLLNARSITVIDTLMITDENGELSTRASSYTEEYPDITNDNGKNGYMAGRIVMVQDPTYDKVIKNKDGDITKFLAYGFECSFNMRWLKSPTYTMKDYFTFCASNGAFTEDNNSLVFSTDAFFIDHNNGFNSSTFISTPAVSTFYSNGWPVSTFNLPTNASNTSNTSNNITHSNYRLSSRARLFALEDFNIIMSYAHKQLVLGDLNVSISTSGPSASISFGGTSHRVYTTHNFFIDLIKDNAMEALKE